ncbi:MAG: hypothetical protein R3C54_07315 [Parvularculaceae bacterium]
MRAFGETFGLKMTLQDRRNSRSRWTRTFTSPTARRAGLFYRLSDISFVGGSLTLKGGRTWLELARLAATILHGPYTFNFVETYGYACARRWGRAEVCNDRELQRLSAAFSPMKKRASP